MAPSRRIEFLGENCAALFEGDVIVATATGTDRHGVAIALWAELLASRRTDLAAVVAKEYLALMKPAAHGESG